MPLSYNPTNKTFPEMSTTLLYGVENEDNQQYERDCFDS